MISVILSTYNRPDALRRVLEGYERLGDAEFEVIVADDGSTPETGELVAAAAGTVSYPLTHVWQADRGFRLAAVRNRAVRQARGDVLVFTDGDCIPFPGCLRLHGERCRRGVMHAGARCLLSEEETVRLLASGRSDGLFDAARERGAAARRRLWWKNRFYRITGLKPRPKLLTANAAVHRDDFEGVNGFDERFEGWGYEDEDLARRLRRRGARAVDGTRDCLVLHLFHPVHVSHRPDARGGANYRYFRSGRFLTRPLRGLERRRVEDLELELRGEVPGRLESIRGRAGGTRREVVVHFGGGPAPRPCSGAEIVLRVPGRREFRSVDDFYRYLEETL